MRFKKIKLFICRVVSAVDRLTTWLVELPLRNFCEEWRMEAEKEEES